MAPQATGEEPGLFHEARRARPFVYRSANVRASARRQARIDVNPWLMLALAALLVAYLVT